MAQELISEHGTPTWIIGRENGGIVIQQGKSYVMLSPVELRRLLEFADHPTTATPTKARIMRYPITAPEGNK